MGDGSLSVKREGKGSHLGNDTVRKTVLMPNCDKPFTPKREDV